MKLKQKLSILLMAVMVFAFALTPATVYADTYSSPEYEWVQALEPLTPEDGVRIESWYWTGDDVVVDAYNQIYIDAKKVDVEATIQKYLGSSEIKFMPTDIAVYIWNSAGRTYKAETLALLKKVDAYVSEEADFDNEPFKKGNQLRFYVEQLQNTSVLTTKASLNTDTKAAEVLKTAGISDYYTITVAGSGKVAGWGSIDIALGDGKVTDQKLDVYYYDATCGKLQAEKKYAEIWAWSDEGTNGDLYLGGSNLMAGTYVLVPKGTKMPETLTVKAPAVTVSSKDVAEVKEKIATLTAGDILGLTVPEKESVSKDILAAAKEKGISIKVESTSGTPTSWSFASIKNVDKDFDPTVTVGANVEAITNVMKNVKLDSVKVPQVSFAHSGDLPGEAEVKLDLSTGNFEEGKTVFLYYFNPTTKLFELVDESVYSYGYATFTMTHCSDYIVTSEKLDGTALVAAPKTGDVSTIPVVVTLIAGCVLVGFVVIRRRKAQ